MVRNQLLKLEDERYWLGEDGVMASNQWHQTEEGKWYYLQEDGKAMRNGWKLIDGDHYYFMKSGVMAVDSLVSGKYRVGPDGRWVH
jgi:glucan-binding YG repeat protein